MTGQRKITTAPATEDASRHTGCGPEHARQHVQQHAQLLALAALFVGAVGISLSPIFVRLADVGPLSSAFWRTGLAVPLFLLLPLLLSAVPAVSMKKTDAKPPAPAATGRQPLNHLPKRRRDMLLLMLAGGFFAADLGVWHISIGMTSVANATLFPNLAPVIVTLVAWLAFGERITRLFVAGLALALGGAVIVIGSSAGIGSDEATPGSVTGDLLALLVAVFYAGYLLTVSRLRRRLGVLAIMTGSSAFAALPLGLAAWLLEAGGSGGLMALLPASLGGLAALLGLALISQVAGQGLIAQALAHLPVSFSSVGLLLQPALAALFGWLLLNETLGTMQMAGMGIILLGIWLARRGGDARP